MQLCVVGREWITVFSIIGLYFCGLMTHAASFVKEGGKE